MNKRIQLANQALRLLPSKSNPRVKRWQAPDEAPTPRRPRGKASVDFGEPSLEITHDPKAIYPFAVDLPVFDGAIDQNGNRHVITPLVDADINPITYFAHQRLLQGLYNALGQPYPVVATRPYNSLSGVLQRHVEPAHLVGVRRRGSDELNEANEQFRSANDPLSIQADKYMFTATLPDLEQDNKELVDGDSLAYLLGLHGEMRGDTPLKATDFTPQDFTQGYLAYLLGAKPITGNLLGHGQVARIGDTYAFVPHANPKRTYMHGDYEDLPPNKQDRSTALLFAMTGGDAYLHPESFSLTTPPFDLGAAALMAADAVIPDFLNSENMATPSLMERAYKKGGRELLEREFPTFVPREWLAQQIVDGEFDELVDQTQDHNYSLIRSPWARTHAATLWRHTKAELARRLPQFY